VIFSLGLSPIFTLTTDLIVGAAPAERAGAASAISETGAELGGALSIAILGTIGTAVYRSRMADSVPDGVPAETAEGARDTLGAAVASAGEVSRPVADQLLEVARESFTDGMPVAAVVSAVLAMTAAVLGAGFLWRLRAAPAETLASA